MVCFAAAFAAVTAFGAQARATVDVVLDYETDRTLTECPTAATFKDEIARQLGHDPFRETGPRRIVVRLSPRRGGVEGRVEWRDASGEVRGERTFWSRTESCAQLAHPIALVTAIQIQLLETAEAGLAPAPPPPPPPPPPAPVPPTLPPTLAAPPIPPAPRDPWIAIDAGVGVLQDFGDGPAMVVPRIAVTVGRPSSFGLRLAASGLGPGADVTRPEGVAQLDRFFMTLEAVRSFRVGRSLEPFFGLGGGWQNVHVHGISAMPMLAPGRDSHAISGMVAASAGLAFMFVPRIAVAAEVQGLLYRPPVTVQIGSSQAARLDGEAIVVHGGLLARF